MAWLQALELFTFYRIKKDMLYFFLERVLFNSALGYSPVTALQ